MTTPEPIGDGLDLLRRQVREPVEHVETFPAPAGVNEVHFTTEEVTSLCPVTGQPDFSGVDLSYGPAERCIESKSLKLYLWKFRDRAVFAEALAAEIAQEVQDRVAPRWVRVTVRQSARGGISLRAVSELGTSS
ncbi:MAG: queF [Acidimicrobiales bacterium]|nr:queF [Acidimicrobiales bacterium]